MTERTETDKCCIVCLDCGVHSILYVPYRSCNCMCESNWLDNDVFDTVEQSKLVDTMRTVMYFCAEHSGHRIVITEEPNPLGFGGAYKVYFTGKGFEIRNICDKVPGSYVDVHADGVTFDLNMLQKEALLCTAC